MIEQRLRELWDQLRGILSMSRSTVAPSESRLTASQTEFAQRICRSIARSEADRTDSDIQPLVEELENVLLRWRSA